MKIIKIFSIIIVIGLLAVGCSNDSTAKVKRAESKAGGVEDHGEEVELLVATAASLQNAMEEIEVLYQKANPNVKISFAFGSSGTLQQQIEQGAPADVFLSAAVKQMTVLEDKDLIIKDTKKELLKNKVVLIIPKNSALDITSFEDIVRAPLIALGNPESVPAGQYAEEVFTSLGILDKVNKKVTYAKDVTEVLTWVSTGNVDAGVVYATDAISSDEVTIAAEAPEGSCSDIIYPVAVVKDSKVIKEATAFVGYLSSPEAIAVFEKYGFTECKLN